MKVGSLFSGVGGFDLGFERAGMEVVWQVEYDKHCRSVLKRHWPNAELYEDVRNVGAALAPVDLICGGFPCQDLSVAGKRRGLEGDRSGLWYEFHRIIAEIAPAWVLIENVPGLLSSNDGRDFAVVLSGLAQLGYGWAYRVLDSQYFGVAQRRRRVFVVGHLGGAERAFDALFPIGTGLPGDTAPSRKAGERTAEGARGSIAFCNTAGNTALGMSKPGVPPLTTRHGDPGITLDTWPGTAMPLMERDYKGPRNYRDGGIQAMCVQSVPRRLTPTECERLQGFPDDWTAGQSDGQRYRQMGNAVTVNVAEWIGRRIMEVEHGTD